MNISTSHAYCSPGQCLDIMRFTCMDYTALAVTELRQQNFTATPLCGWLNHGYHAWVGLEINKTFYNIEPQTGKIVFPNPDRDVSYYVGARPCVVRGVV